MEGTPPNGSYPCLAAIHFKSIVLPSSAEPHRNGQSGQNFCLHPLAELYAPLQGQNMAQYRAIFRIISSMGIPYHWFKSVRQFIAANRLPTVLLGA